ncbi:MAG: TIGR02757 family protein [Thermaurantimonas sp.]
MNLLALKDYLDSKADYYESELFVGEDPISVPHRYTQRGDIEISALLTATISWGNRKSIIRSAQNMMRLMDDSPYDFICNHTDGDLISLKKFVHRTFKGEDALFFVKSLNKYYRAHSSLETIFLPKSGEQDLMNSIVRFRSRILSLEPAGRSGKHIADPSAGSAAKRIHMFLRWMVRSSVRGVDFGIWRRISPSLLSCPLDVHTGTTARALGLLTRRQNDLKAVRELDSVLRRFDPSDPVRYDYALFGIGLEKKSLSPFM